MNIILTHEQTDFDALGALLGASLLHPEYTPVLPRKINRNGQAFVARYQNDLPFIAAQDLPSEAIENILLVDTQSLVTLKGMGKKVRVRVIDHHPTREDTPKDWEVRLEKTGACTTLFVEELEQQETRLAGLLATLLLLGIYEDTGSLTYGSTTPRDARAAAYLLEKGADLGLVGEFLNPPLSNEQTLLYDRLIANTEAYDIQGQNILIATADAGELHEEISSIAHKIRDLLDPDALFLLVKTGEGVRLVARSSTDRVNVASVASAFGGGGHPRAAAALIHNLPPSAQGSSQVLEDVAGNLYQLLQHIVRPSITVGKIMSPRPHIISPSTSVQEAARLMQRYGYEGFPVVKGGKVVGLLTRRAVDRAVAHKLDLTAASLMEAGDISVEPGHSLDSLQRIMAASGWGQIPVVDPDNGKVVGIVTRTDLLKTLTDQPQKPLIQNLAARLEAALPPARLALLQTVANHAFDQDVAVYIVGGFVRDLLLGRPSLDFDVVVEGNAIALANSLSTTYGGRVVHHTRFGTAKWTILDIRSQLAHLLPLDTGPLDPDDLPESLDFITARTEFYDRPTALPTIEDSSIKLDLHRRDFTINTLALRLDGQHYGELHDYWGGLNDLRHGLVRVLHSLSFIDDPTRLMRAVRFEQRFGFTIEERTLQLMNEAADLLKQVSGDRIRHELDLILSEAHPYRMLDRLHELKLLPAIHPDLPWDEIVSAEMKQFGSSLPDPEWEISFENGNSNGRRKLLLLIWLGRLPEDTSRRIGKRLKFSHVLLGTLIDCRQLWEELLNLREARPSAIAKVLDGKAPLAIYTVYLLNGDPQIRSLLLTYITRWRHITPTINGHDLVSMGLPPGRLYRDILETLRNAWLDGDISSPEEEKQHLDRLLQQV